MDRDDGLIDLRFPLCYLSAMEFTLSSNKLHDSAIVAGRS